MLREGFESRGDWIGGSKYYDERWDSNVDGDSDRQLETSIYRAYLVSQARDLCRLRMYIYPSAIFALDHI